jgi:transcription elongation factor Elf1
MSKEEEICCSNCGIICDQTLLLSCDHNLCMNCAANNLVRNELPGMNKIQYIICDICQQKTEIDTNTSKEVLSLGLNNLNKNNEEIEKNLDNINEYEYNTFQENNQKLNLQNSLMNSNNNNDFESPVNIVYFNTSNNNLNNLSSKYDITDIKNNINRSNICQDHGEPITYLCLDCMSKCICSECVVHGIHRNHEVLNIKKAYPLIYNKTQEIGNHINTKIKELFITQKNIEQKKKEIGNLNNKCRIDIRQAFDELRSLLNKKEKEIMDKTENTLNDNINELNTYNHIIQSKILLLNKLSETVNVYLMRKNELSLINFYTENKNKILSQTEFNEINDINELNLEGMSNLKIDIDKCSFDAMISAINTLNFEINTFRGFDVKNRHNLGKFTAKRNLYGNKSEQENFNNLKNENENKNEKEALKKKKNK